MVIHDYIVPKGLQENPFVQSLKRQYDTKGELSNKQLIALEDLLEISLDFYEWDHRPDPDSEFFEDYFLLLDKLKRNRFRKTKNRNKCIRALENIILGKGSCQEIDTALGRNFNPYHRYGRRW